MTLKVVSWNIWIDGFLQAWEEFLADTNADIVGLQEVKDDDPERDIIGVLEQRGYKCVFAHTEQVWDGKRYRHGPAVFSKLPIVHSEKIQLAKGNDERAAAYVQIDVDGTIMHIFSTHLIHTHQQPSQQQEEQTRRLVKKLPSEHVLVMGDFNATPDSISVQAMREVLRDTDSLNTPTWSVYPEGCTGCSPQKVDTKLDYIFTSKDLKTHSFAVGQSKGSDHLPVSVLVEV